MRSKRFEALDARPVNQDGYVSEWPEVGLIAMDSPNDPKPSIKLSDGKVVELDGKTRDQFDMIDTFVADYGINLERAEEAMAIDSLQVARMLCDINVPRHKIIPLTTAMTPAKLTEVVGNMSVLEMMMAVTKLRARKQPANQCHVTNVLDHPVQIAADSAEAALRGFAEQETTVGVVRYAPFNALALLVGAQTGRPGILTQCAVEEATELQRGHARADRLRRDRLGLRHRGCVHGRRRHPVVEGVPRLQLRLPRPEDALHLRHRLRGADGLRRGQVECCTWSPAACS